MDGIKATANIISTIRLGIKSTQGIRDALSALKDGPIAVAQLTKDVESFSAVLRRLAEYPLDSSSPDTVAALKTHLDTCTKVLSDTKDLLKDFNNTPTSRADRIRMGFRAVRKDKDLEDAHAQIRHCGTQLNLHLALLQAESTANTSLLNASNAKETGSVLQQILGEFEKVHDRLDRMGNSAAVEEPADTRTKDASGIIEPELMEACSDLQESISRLSDLAHHKESTLDTEDAEQIIDDLQKLIQFATDHICRDQATLCQEHKKSRDERNRSLRKEMRQIEGMIYAAPELAINRKVAGPSNFIANIPDGSVIRQKRIREEIDIGCGIFTITANKRRRLTQENFTGSSPNSSKSSRDTVAKILFRPANHPSAITITVTQGQLLDQITQSIPRISINPIIPSDSPVFEVVRQGRIGEFRAMLAEGITNLRVHDQTGQGLLHHAVEWPQICTLLIEAGVDVDEIGGGMTPLIRAQRRGYTSTMRLLLQNEADPSLATHSWTEPLESSSSDARTSDLELYWNYSRPFLLDQINEFSNSIGVTLLHRVCNAWDESPTTYCTRNALAVLVEAGADVGARAVKAAVKYLCPGSTCLHTLASMAHHPSTKDELDSLVYLIEKGALVNAIDDAGYSVSMRAYGSNEIEREGNFELVGCYRGDLWDAALVTHGYDLLEFRRDYPRVPRYDLEYQREDFERLWEGIEHLCPYWNDSRWPETGGDSDYWAYSTDEDSLSNYSEISDDSDTEEPDHEEFETGRNISPSPESDQESDVVPESQATESESPFAESLSVLDDRLYGSPATEEPWVPDWVDNNSQIRNETMSGFSPLQGQVRSCSGISDQSNANSGGSRNIWRNVVLEDPWVNT